MVTQEALLTAEAIPLPVGAEQTLVKGFQPWYNPGAGSEALARGKYTIGLGSLQPWLNTPPGRTARSRVRANASGVAIEPKWLRLEGYEVGTKNWNWDCLAVKLPRRRDPQGSRKSMGTQDWSTEGTDPARWRNPARGALLFVLAGAMVAGLVWLSRPQSDLTAGTSIAESTPAPTSTSTMTPIPTWTPTITPVPPTPTPTILHPTISSVTAEVDDEAASITFQIEARIPPDRGIDELVLWYDTERGHQLLHNEVPLSTTIRLRYRLDAVAEGLTRTITTTPGLDYWWLVRDTAGDVARAGGTVRLGPALLSMVAEPSSVAADIGYTWAMSETVHYSFHYKPGSAAERDRFLIGATAEEALDRIGDKLEMGLDQQMRLYLVPRVFWQGGAAYGDKVQLISYLDRNYVGVETWTYFTHEGTHALAQDLLQPKENGGGPDGVLVEGLAVWATGGHYRLEPIDAWAALIVDSEGYLSLPDLRAGGFYDFQHETSYTEAASFVAFLVDGYGLDRLKELYGRASGDAELDETLMMELYGKGYTALDAGWLAYLDTLSPTPEQAETWHLKVRSFDLMRRYQTELDPNARILPSTPPPEWDSETFETFWQRLDAPVNVVLETALIAAQERLWGDDPLNPEAGAAVLLDDVEAALDAGGALERPSLQAREDILDLLSEQDRAILVAHSDAYLETVAADGALALRPAALLEIPFTSYRQEVVRLDVAADGLSAEGVVLVHAQVIPGGNEAYANRGNLFAVTFVREAAGDPRWRMASRRQTSAARLSGLGPLPGP